MTSAYGATIECEQKITAPREFVKICFDDRELDNPNSSVIGMEEISSSQTSLVVSDSSLEELAICFIENSTLSDKSDNHENVNEKTRQKEDKAKILDIFLNLTTDSSEVDKSENEKESSENTDKDRHKEMKENEKKDSNPISIAYGSTLEDASTCRTTKKEQIREQGRSKDPSKNKQNQTALGIQMQERPAIANDNNIYIKGNFEELAMMNARVYCENAAESCLDTDERQDENGEREIVGQNDNDKLFYDAVRSGNVKRVSILISSGDVQNLDEPDWNVSGDPPLLMAATNHYPLVLGTLLASGCDPTVRSPRGETALHRVILNSGLGNMLQLVQDLLKHGCPPGVKEAGSGSTALHVLSRQLAHTPLKSLHHNFDAALKTLELLANAGPVNTKDHQGRSALHILASSTIFDNNHKTDIESLIGTLLAAGINTALKNDRGETALHESLECGALNIATLLIPSTPAGIASRYGETPLHIASRKNYIDIVKKLLKHGEDPSTQDAGGNTSLHLASARGFHQTVSLLVSSPSTQLEKINIDGLTALQVAAESGFINAVKILLKAGADPSQTMHYCATIMRRHPDISVLIDHELTRRRQLAT